MFKVGDRVKHSMFGKGEIVKIRNDGNYTVLFDKENWLLHDGDIGIPDRCWFVSEACIELVEEFKMTKKDLKNGDIVTLRNGDKLALWEESFTDISEENHNMLCVLDDLDDNLIYVRYGDRDEDFDVVKVERPVKYETVFEREEVKELTVDEISEKLGYKVKVVGVEK